MGQRITPHFQQGWGKLNGVLFSGHWDTNFGKMGFYLLARPVFQWVWLLIEYFLFRKMVEVERILRILVSINYRAIIPLCNSPSYHLQVGWDYLWAMLPISQERILSPIRCIFHYILSWTSLFLVVCDDFIWMYWFKLPLVQFRTHFVVPSLNVILSEIIESLPTRSHPFSIL